ncbi:unnamed protein product [Lactuca saligna]|uniref:At2g35280-like TPR domain-containing protein n=1 Tax=Lactuca saligna TaxID=75948 RepID=A0AA36A124_LACSI|nr:unnamed protein product [Lactuca saligna]
MQTRQQGTRITAFPSQLFEKIITTVGGNSPINAFKCQLVCKLFGDSLTSDIIYKIIDTNRLMFRPLSIQPYEVISKCRKLNSPHILFNNGMYFMIGEEIAGKQLLQDANDQGQLDAIFEECFYYGHFDLGLSLLRQVANEDHLEAIYLLGMICISRGPHQCDEGLQLLDTYFGWVVPDDGEYTGVVDSAKELLQAVDVVHRLTTNNITFQCEDPQHSVKGVFAIGHEEDEDRQSYCMVCR